MQRTGGRSSPSSGTATSAAGVVRVRTAAVETAPVRQGVGVRDLPGDHVEPGSRGRAGLRHRPEQPLRCTGAAASGTARSTVAISTTWPAYITAHAVAEVGDDAEVVGDEQDRHAELVAGAAA